MGGMLAAGCLLMAYSPAAAVILGYTARRSALLVLTIGAAFVWLLAILLASLVWLAIPPLKVRALVALHPSCARGPPVVQPTHPSSRVVRTRMQGTPAFTATVSVVCQEALRWLVVWAYVK